MTREEAIEILKDLWRTKHSTYLEADIRKALDMAINALSQECVEPTHKHVGKALDMRCEDAISRQAVLETLDDMDNVLDEDRTIENYKELLKECYEVLPSVKPQKNIVNNGTMNITL